MGVTALANTKNPMYQACVWEKGVCKGSQSEGGHEAVVFCGGWCEKRAEMGPAAVLALNKIPGAGVRCMKGDRTILPKDDPNGLVARITSPAVCERVLVNGVCRTTTVLTIGPGICVPSRSLVSE